MQISRFEACEDHTGERPYWDADTGTFYWIDVFGRRIHRRDAAGRVQTWTLPSLIGSFALIDPDRAVVTQHNGFFLFEFATGRCELLGFPDPGASGNLRLNDGKVDSGGRFVCGGADYFRRNPIGGLYSLDGARHMRALADDIIVANGLTWSPDGRWIYYADSFRHVIYRASYDPATGAAGERQEFARFGKEEGMPDGACTDTEGCLWVAMVYGGKLLRLRPDGSREREFPMPVKAPTSVAFGGRSMDRLFVTSKSRSATGEALDPGLGGSVLVIDGLPANGHAERRMAWQG